MATTAGVAVGTTYTGGTGVDTISFGAQTAASTLGDGNDVAYFTGAALGAGGSVDLGDGTDEVGLTAANAITASLTEAFETAVTNYEALTMTATAGAGTINMANLNSVTAIEFSGAVGHATVLSNLEDNTTVTFKAAATAGTTHTLATTTGSQTHNLVFSNAATSAFNYTVAGVETINITSTDLNGSCGPDSDYTATLVGTSATTVTVTGNAGLNLTNTGNKQLQALMLLVLQLQLQLLEWLPLLLRM